MAKKFYAIKRGRAVGIYTNWEDCKPLVDNYERPVYRGFMSRAEAEAWLNDCPQPSNPLNVDFIIYTDGSCLSNPDGPGGYAAIIVTTDRPERIVTGGAPSTTNNRMELQGVIMGLRALPKRASAAVVTDSRYVCNAFAQGWVRNWQRDNRLSPGSSRPLKNPDLWRMLLAEMEGRDVTFHWVRGHNANAYNERCDALARAEALKLMGAAVP